MSVRVLPPPKVSTIDDLLKVEGKAELINGRIVRSSPNGHGPSIVAGRIFRSLAQYSEARQCGEAFMSKMGSRLPSFHPAGNRSHPMRRITMAQFPAIP